ncbi:MAG: class B sortase [Bacilli bacterium]|nr:class B sortase [Bacilli bacterium]
MINEIKRKYSFLSDSDAKTLYLLVKSGISYDTVKNLNAKQINEYVKRHVNELKKINKNSTFDKEGFVSDIDVNTLFLLKKKKITISKLQNKLSEIKNINIKYYPNSNIIINKAKKKVLLSSMANLCVMIISLVVLISNSFSLFNWDRENKEIKKISAQVVEEVEIKEEEVKKEDFVIDDYFKYKDVSMMNVNFNDLLKQNSDTKGWIKVNNTNINYPFVQASDNEYYLKHSFDKKANKKGWVFLDYRNDINNLGKNNILYAHGLVNNAMFGSMRNVVKKNWYTNKDNNIIKLSTPNSNQLWQVFSTYTIEPESYYIETDFSTDEEFINFANTLKDRSIYNYNVELNKNDKILTLSSCYDNTKRMVMHAKLIAITKK